MVEKFTIMIEVTFNPIAANPSTILVSDIVFSKSKICIRTTPCKGDYLINSHGNHAIASTVGVAPTTMIVNNTMKQMKPTIKKRMNDGE